jgi:hypothetical protein
MSISANVSAPASTMVPLARIPTDVGAQTRVRVRASVVRDYAAAMKQQRADEDLRFPPVVLFTDGQNHWLGDGFHRVLAAARAGLTEIAADVRQGTQRDAVLFGISANSAHGLPRSNADKRKAVTLMLGDAEWSQWSDRKIAGHCQVGNAFVSRLRRESASVSGTQMRGRKVERSGTVYEMKVAPRDRPDAVTSPEILQPAAVTDPLGIPLPESRALVFTAHGDFREAQSLFERLSCILDKIAQGPAGELYRQDMIRTADAGLVCAAVRMGRNKLLAAEPYCCYCPNCHPTHPIRPYPTCQKCGGRGWTTRAAFESCQASAREHIMKMRAPSALRA